MNVCASDSSMCLTTVHVFIDWLIDWLILKHLEKGYQEGTTGKFTSKVSVTLCVCVYVYVCVCVCVCMVLFSSVKQWQLILWMSRYLQCCCVWSPPMPPCHWSVCWCAAADQLLSAVAEEHDDSDGDDFQVTTKKFCHSADDVCDSAVPLQRCAVTGRFQFW